MRYLHLNDNNKLDFNDKYTKIRLSASYLQRKFMTHFVLSQNISHDEAMVEYFGKHSYEQAMRNKLIRYGVKTPHPDI